MRATTCVVSVPADSSDKALSTPHRADTGHASTPKMHNYGACLGTPVSGRGTLLLRLQSQLMFLRGLHACIGPTTDAVATGITPLDAVGKAFDAVLIDP